MSERLKELTEARAKAWATMNELRETIGNAAATAEQRAEWDRIEADIVELGSDLDRESRAAKMALALAQPVDERITPGAPEGEDAADEKRYADIYSRYLRTGLGEGSRLNVEERLILAAREARAQSTTTTAGGYLVPQGYLTKITETMKAFGGLLSIANIIHTETGNILPWPSNNDTGNLGALLSENTQVTEVDVAFTTQQLAAWTYTSNSVLVSLQLLQDSAFDLDSWLPKKLGQRLGRAIAADLVTGTGTTKPVGVDNAPTTGVTGGTGSTTAALWGATAYGKAYGDLVSLIHSVDAAYRQMGNCKFLMNDLTLGAIRAVTDTQGRPLWTMNTQQSAVGPDPDTILGYPVVVDNAMPVMGVSAKSILFGDFEQGYIVRQVLDPTIMRLVERYADYLQVGFIGFQRIDGRPDDAAAVLAFVNSAT